MSKESVTAYGIQSYVLCLQFGLNEYRIKRRTSVPTAQYGTLEFENTTTSIWKLINLTEYDFVTLSYLIDVG
jgi:hypothetical protein